MSRRQTLPAVVDAPLEIAPAPVPPGAIPLPGGMHVTASDVGRANVGGTGPAAMRAVGGSQFLQFNVAILDGVTSALPACTSPAERAEQVAVAAAALAAFRPRDEIEGMLAAQAVALHFAAMTCLRRAMHAPADRPQLAAEMRKGGANLARAAVDMIDALDRKRGKRTKHVVRVEKVVVKEGGQAVIGAVEAGGSGE